MITLYDIQSRIAATVDQTVTPPSAGSAEWELRRSFINRAIEEWGQAYDWDTSRRTEFLNITSGPTVALPMDFKKMSGFPLLFGDVAEGEGWPEIQEHEAKRYTVSDHYYYINGDRANGYFMMWHPATLSSGASLMIQFYSFPTSLASPASMSVIGDPEFVVDRSIAYIFQSRNDARFQQFEAQAREKLLLMIDTDNERSRAYRSRVETPERAYHDFRLGRD